MKSPIIKKGVILIAILWIALGILPGSFRFLNHYRLNASEDTEFWDPKSDSTFDSSVIKKVNAINQYITFTEFEKNISTYDDNFLNTHKIILENAMDLYNLSKGSHINILEEANRTNKLKYLKGNYVLGNDINYDDASSKSLFFIPIGSDGFPFKGSFDGNGFEIRNLFFISINTREEYDQQYAGLKYMSMFGSLDRTAILRNFGLLNPTMILVSNFDVLENASYIAGENRGLIENVYVVDNQSVTGMACEGGYRFAGMIVDHFGTFKTSYLSVSRVTSIEVNQKLSVGINVLNNLGLIENVYYDSSILTEVIENKIPEVKGITTSELNNPAVTHFQDYFYKDSYTNLTINTEYPILKGITEQKISGNHYRYLISSEVEFIYMFELINLYGYFRNKEFVLDSCIDLSKLSRNIFKGLNVSFDGKFTSEKNDMSPDCDHYIYEDPSLKSQYHTISNLTIENGNLIDNRYTYGLFGYSTGTLENFNLMGVKILLNDVTKLEASYDVGLLIGYSRGAKVNNVRIGGIIDFSESKLISVSGNAKTISNLSAGGIVGRGEVSITNSSVSGDILGAVITPQAGFNHSSIGGILGYAENASITGSTSKVNMKSFSFNNMHEIVSYYGGILGRGTLIEYSRNYSAGKMEIIIANPSLLTGIGLYVSGGIGLLEGIRKPIFQVTTETDITINQSSNIKARFSGFANIRMTDKISLNSIGAKFSYIIKNTASSIDLSRDNQLKMTYGILLMDTEANINGIFTHESIDFKSSFDLSTVHEFAANLIAEDINEKIERSQIVNSVNKTNNFFVTNNDLMMNYIKLSNNLIGKNMDMDRISNEGELNVYITRPATSNFYIQNIGGINYYKEFKIFGLFEEVSLGHRGNNLLNSGDIFVKTAANINTSNVVRFNFLIGGLGYKNANSNIYAENNIRPQDIKVDASILGSLNNCLNYGNIYADLNIYGQSRIGGIVNINSSMITNAFNFGNIYNRNAVQATQSGGNQYTEGQFEVESGGICYLMNERFAQIKDSVNSGDIISISTTTNGWVNSSGIAIRNDKREDGKSVTGNDNSHYAKIQFSANYGNIVSYNYVTDSNENVSEYRNKASGILAMGLLSTINVVNYGNIYGKTTASGVYSHIALNKFTILAKETYVSNSMNYGKIRKINENNSASGIFMSLYDYDKNRYFTLITEMITYLENSSNVSQTTSFGIGALIGLIDFTNSGNNVNTIEFSYLINFDDQSDVVGRTNAAPTVTNDQIKRITQYMATVKSDTSPTPFTGIKQYTMSTNSDGVFSDNFPLRNPPKNSSVETDKYISDYVQFVPYSKVNPLLLARIGFDKLGIQNDSIGIYALSSSTGIQHGVFLPDNIQLEDLNISKDPSSPQYNQFIVDELIILKQLLLSISTEVFDLELVNVLDENIKLNNPIIDSKNQTLTYYIAGNQSGSRSPLCIGNSCGTETVVKPGGSKLKEEMYITPNQYPTVNALMTYLIGLNPLFDKVRIFNDPDDLNSYSEFNKSQIADTTILGKRVLNSDGVNFVNVGYYDSSHQSINKAFYGGNSDIVLRDRTQVDDWMARPKYDETTVMDPLTNENHRYVIYGSGNKTLNNAVDVGTNYGLFKSVASTQYTYVGPRADYNSTFIRVQMFEKVPDTTVDVDLLFSQFRINHEQNFKLAFNAIFKSDYANSENDYYNYGRYVSVPRFIGEEETALFSNRLGKVSIIAEDRSVIREYTLIIKRTQDRTAGIDEITMDGNDMIPNLDHLGGLDFEIRNTSQLDSANGILSFSLLLDNFKDGYNLLKMITIYEWDADSQNYIVLNPRGQREINHKILYYDHYILEDGEVHNSHTELDGVLGSGFVQIKLKMNSYTPGKKYRIHFNLSETQNISFIFTKAASKSANIQKMIYNQNEQIVGSNTIQTEIEYGKYYDPLFSDMTMNFTNLNQISNVPFDQIADHLPLYLNELEISLFSVLKSVQLDIQKNNDLYTYNITYVIEAEDKSIQEIKHIIQESPLNLSIQDLYRDGNKMALNINEWNQATASFLREESPNFRIEYYLHNLYLPKQDLIQVENLDSNIHVTIVPNVGFELFFTRDSDVKDYNYSLNYLNQTTILGYNLEWNVNFQAVRITKNANINSLLDNIKFVSDTVYSGLNTIMDNELLTIIKYQQLLLNPQDRKITVLPSKIYYNDTPSIDHKYYVIGQVQKTNLSNYSPSFEIPMGASIYRLDSQGNEFGDGTVSSKDLSTEYLFTSNDAFMFVTYRVYAENKSYYTDYCIAVQDITYNVRFDFEINLLGDILPAEISRIFISLFNFKNDLSGNPIKDLNSIDSRTHFYSHYNSASGAYENLSLSSNKSGYYQIDLNLGRKYLFDYMVYDGANKLTVSAEDKAKNGFIIPSSIVSKKYRIVLNIYRNTQEDPWGVGGSTEI